MKERTAGLKRALLKRLGSGVGNTRPSKYSVGGRSSTAVWNVHHRAKYGQTHRRFRRLLTDAASIPASFRHSPADVVSATDTCIF